MHFNNPIEQIVNSSSNADLRRMTYDNALKAKSTGIEIEFRKKLNFIRGFKIRSLNFIKML